MLMITLKEKHRNSRSSSRSGDVRKLLSEAKLLLKREHQRWIAVVSTQHHHPQRFYIF